MNRARPLFALLLLFALLQSCKEGNPVVSLPTDPSGPPADVFTVAIASESSQVEAGTSAVPLTVTARRADGTFPTDGTEVTLNTSLGSFGVDSAGKPVQLTKATLVGGRATVQFFPGSELGVANILAQLGTNVGRLNLTIVQPPPLPVADFTFSTNGLTVLFTDATTGTVTSRTWQFGDGSSSASVSPSHTYATPGTYTVTLTVSNSSGSNSKSKFVTVNLGEAPKAEFESTVQGMQVNFVDKSTGNPTSWTWTFGDGTSSNQRNPIHTYPAAGTYTVTLTASNAGGSSAVSHTVTIAAAAAPEAKFSFEVSGRQVNFIDKSTGSPTSWSWNFGDGTSSSQQNPIHTYAASGNYTVTLTVSNASGSNSTSQIVSLTPATPPQAAFDVTTTQSSLQANFIDQSTGNPTSWFWNFGDGTPGSTQRNPVHTYAAAGTYTATLTVSNANGSTSTSKAVTVPMP
ncbi:MAG TPA: PKD domain-containing protein [Thermoanaerobaculia bacterium]|nr:PKD domain-containing protein [Thermoanaerobaculia bacterium]